MVADFVPKTRLLSNITISTTATITTTEDHGYEVDQFLRVYVEMDYGMVIF